MKRFGILTLCVALSCGAAASADEGKSFQIGVKTKYELKTPANWIVKQPRSNIIDFEFEVPVAEGDEIPGRVTVMGALGGVDANIARWKTQFKNADGEEVTPDIKQFEVGGQQIHLVDFKGTYADSPGGPFAGGKTIQRPDYRMLGVIISTKEDGQYYVKFYGPAKTVTAAEGEFKKMLEGMIAK